LDSANSIAPSIVPMALTRYRVESARGAEDPQFSASGIRVAPRGAPDLRAGEEIIESLTGVAPRAAGSILGLAPATA
jgi:hypothetical protein